MKMKIKAKVNFMFQGIINRRKKYIFNLGDNFLVKIVFNIVFLFLSFNLFINFFVYTYYITFYVALLNISLLSKFMYVYIESVRVRAFLMKIIILISILLIHVPLQGIFFFYRINKKWMNKVIVFVLCL